MITFNCSCLFTLLVMSCCLRIKSYCRNKCRGSRRSVEVVGPVAETPVPDIVVEQPKRSPTVSLRSPRKPPEALPKKFKEVRFEVQPGSYPLLDHYPDYEAGASKRPLWVEVAACPAGQRKQFLSARLRPIVAKILGPFRFDHVDVVVGKLLQSDEFGLIHYIENPHLLPDLVQSIYQQLQEFPDTKSKCIARVIGCVKGD